MVWVALDVAYGETQAVVAAVAFAGPTAVDALWERRLAVAPIAPYIPGEFYRRELPCLLAALKDTYPDVVVVDGYVDLSPTRPGLGRYLYQKIQVPVIGVAKTAFLGAVAQEVIRGGSLRPLYVTAAGLDLTQAAQNIQAMAGPHRLPTLLKRADQLCRG